MLKFLLMLGFIWYVFKYEPLSNDSGIIGSTILMIAAPPARKVPLMITGHLPLLIEAPKTLLICEPGSEVNVYLHEYDKGLRCLILSLINPGLESHKFLLEGIFKAVTTHEAFIKFGNVKSIIVSAVMFKECRDLTSSGSNEFNIHHNVLITPTTTFNQYYNEVSEFVNSNLEHGYGYEVIEYYKVKCWNLDLMRNAKIKLSKGKINLLGYRSYSTGSASNLNNKGKGIFISPIKVDVDKNQFATMDIETMNIKGIQTPVAISSCNENGSKLFLIDSLLLHSNLNLAVNNLWKQYFDYIINQGDKLILAHNLGNFDGYFLYKALVNYFDPRMVECLIDDSKSFISIKLLSDNKIEWKDSCRLFPMSLDKLCNLFGGIGKLVPYNSKFNDISLFNNPKSFGLFKKYALQDAVALFESITMAQITYFNKFKVDITTVVSSPTLSLKIFRSNFLSLSREIDEFVRFGYYGGGTDYYKAYETNLKYYDVNSLYPLAMKNPMPLNLIKYHKNMDYINLNHFFGFIEVEVTCPTTMLRPVLPFKVDGKTIYPVGNWTAIYFSEELKAVQSLGYKFRLIRGYEFSKADLFSKYVDHFFNIKRTSQGSEKGIAKLHLNALYGYFGRRQDLIETINVTNESLPKYLTTRIVKEILKINDEYSTLLLSANINHKVLRNLNMICESNIQSSNRIVMSNVTIAAAVTAYARIHMIYYKLLPGTVYTDTDSIFTTDILPSHLLGDGLGQMKDELNGGVIEEGLFLGLKKYGYWYIDAEGRKIEASVFAGVRRNSLSFGEIIDLN